jgi:hypothetical protein
MPSSLQDRVYHEFGFRRLKEPLTNRNKHRLSNPDGLLLEHGLKLAERNNLFVPMLLIDPQYDVMSETDSVFYNMIVAIAPLTQEEKFEGPLINLRASVDMSTAVLQAVGHNTE